MLGEFKRPGARIDQPRPGGEARSQKEAAEDAGLSKRQKDKAVSVAKVPEGQFEEMVEGDDPKTASQIAAYDTAPVAGTIRGLRTCQEPPPPRARLMSRLTLT